MTKINLTLKLSKNYQTVEIGATDIDLVKYFETEQWLIEQGKHALNEICGDTTEPTVTTTTSTYQSGYQPGTQPKGAMASQKQINFLRGLGYTGPVDDMSVTEADALLKEWKAKKNIK